MPLTGDGVDLRIPLLAKAVRVCPQRAGDRPKPPDGALRTDAPYLQASDILTRGNWVGLPTTPHPP